MSVEVPYNLLGLILGVIGVVGIIPLIWALICYQLPAYKLKQLDAALQETATFFQSVAQEGLIPELEYVEMRNRLRLHRDATESLKAEVLCADGFQEQCIAAVHGLSGRVKYLHTEVKKLRVRIARTSDEERRKAAERSAAAAAVETSGVSLNRNPVDDSETDSWGSELQALSVAVLTMPSPTYVHCAPDTLYRPVHHETMSSESSDNGSSASTSMLWLPAPWMNSLLQARAKSPPYLRSSSPSLLPRWSSTPATTATDDDEQHPQQITQHTTDHSHSPSASSTMDSVDSHRQIAELSEQILEFLKPHIVTSIQFALERSRSSWDFEAEPHDLEPASHASAH